MSGWVSSSAPADASWLINPGVLLRLQLFGYHACSDPSPAIGHNQVGNVHFSINCEDVDAKHAKHAKHAELTATGAHDLTPIVVVPAPGLRSFYVCDPDGVPVEFITAHWTGS